MPIEDQYREWEETGRQWVGNLMPTLRGHGCLWHRCTVEGLQGIVRAGEIRPAGEGTEKSCVTDCQAHRLGAVPLFDFDTPSEREVYRAAKMGWAGFLNENRQCITIWLRVPVGHLDPTKLVIQGTEATLNNPLVYHGFKWIPWVEAWHPGPIAWAHVDQVWAARKPYGGGDYNMTPLDLADPVPEAQALRREWDEDWERRRAADRAEGKIDIAEALEAARARRFLVEPGE
ncbi:hypothetical protein [Mesoterricola sediminis]|uniref:Uncharacterized protein n=1 Tax=Mesoterricola sediminis TaxID=2927980 RepID=A0AA48GRE9_9BACT|nr:hypothetical protein [Mesoterricola sediminis]BDU76197.1 hypothetical protein METESE_11550 [Mesoterricola sediminis]